MCRTMAPPYEPHVVARRRGALLYSASLIPPYSDSLFVQPGRPVPGAALDLPGRGSDMSGFPCLYGTEDSRGGFAVRDGGLGGLCDHSQTDSLAVLRCTARLSLSLPAAVSREAASSYMEPYSTGVSCDDATFLLFVY